MLFFVRIDSNSEKSEKSQKSEKVKRSDYLQRFAPQCGCSLFVVCLTFFCIGFLHLCVLWFVRLVFVGICKCFVFCLFFSMFVWQTTFRIHFYQASVVHFCTLLFSFGRKKLKKHSTKSRHPLISNSRNPVLVGDSLSTL